MMFTLPLNVSRETQEKLAFYQSELKKWNRAINLVSSESMKDGAQRHIGDSAQLFSLAPKGTNHWVDLGSGGGLPGLVVSIIASEVRPEMGVTLVEADSRKCTFIREVARKLELSLAVENCRIEHLKPQNAEVVSARALAPLPKLLEYCARHMDQSGVALLMKGARYRDELEDAQKEWKFDVTTFASATDMTAAILEVRNVIRINPMGPR